MSASNPRVRADRSQSAVHLAVSIVASAAFVTSLAQAQAAPEVAPAESTTAQVLFDDAQHLLAEGRFDEACAKLKDSQKLDPAAGTLLNLGRCYEKSGKLAAALVAYQEATAIAQRTGRGEWVVLSARRIAALDARVPRIVVRVPIPGTEVTRDGTPLAAAEMGLALPVDPGNLVLDAHAPGKRPWRRALTLAEGERVEIDVGPLEDEPAPTAATRPAIAKGAEEPAQSGGGARNRIAAAGVAGLGVVGIGIGVGFGVAALQDRDRATFLCPAKSGCTAPAVQAANDARSAAPISTAALIAGGALVTLGAVLYFTAPAARADHAGARPVWRVTLGSGGIGWEGTF